jgi:hypothetical protein
MRMAQCFPRAYRKGVLDRRLLESLAVESVVLMKSELRPCRPNPSPA